MYSPKVSEELIPQLYKLAKEQGRPMTKVLDELIRDKLIEKNKTESTLPQTKPKVA
jgi:hypothetical protein